MLTETSSRSLKTVVSSDDVFKISVNWDLFAQLRIILAHCRDQTIVFQFNVLTSWTERNYKASKNIFQLIDFFQFLNMSLKTRYMNIKILIF